MAMRRGKRDAFDKLAALVGTVTKRQS